MFQQITFFSRHCISYASSLFSRHKYLLLIVYLLLSIILVFWSIHRFGFGITFLLANAQQILGIILLSFFLSFCFIALSSFKYFNLKKLRDDNVRLSSTVLSVSKASIFDFATPAKMNDLVRLVGDNNKKLAIAAILSERLLDVTVLLLFVLTNLSSLSLVHINYLFLLIAIILFIQIYWPPFFVDKNFSRLVRLCLAFLASVVHWLLAYNLYSRIWFLVSSSVDSLSAFELSSIPTLISISDFSKIVLLSTLPLTPLAGYGSREVSAAIVFHSFPIASAFITLCYSALLGLFAIVSGIITSISIKSFNAYVRRYPGFRLRQGP